MLSALTQWLAFSMGWKHVDLPPLDNNTHPKAPPDGTFRVAIIGAGIGGASAAYEMRQSSALEPFGRNLEITVFEADSRVGGRVKSVIAWDGAHDPEHVEAGASYFYDDDECIINAVNEAGLHRSLNNLEYKRKGDEEVGVWDGKELTLRKNSEFFPKDWKDEWKLFFHHGTSPRKVRELGEDGRARLQRFYSGLYYNNGNLKYSVYSSSPIGLKRQTARQVLNANNVSSGYMVNVVEARIRGVQAKDIDGTNDLSLFRSFTSVKPRYIPRLGAANQAVIARLLRLADVNLRLNTKAYKIDHGTNGKYKILTTYNPAVHDKGLDEYDAIIIACPLRSANIEILGSQLAEHMPEYEERHVTHFTTRDDLSPGYFDLPTSIDLPNAVYTIRNPDVPFYGIETSRVSQGLQGCILEMQNMFRIVSEKPVSDELILKLLGKQENVTLSQGHVEWVHRQVWPHAFPKLSNRTQPIDIELFPRIHYAGKGEEFESSLENSCRFGVWAGRRVWTPDLEIVP